MAGIIATYINYDPPPWQVTELNKNRVTEIRKFISSPASSWKRIDSGVNMVWNGADEDAHRAAVEEPQNAAGHNLCQRGSDDCNPDQTPEVTSKLCNGIDNKHYITKDTIGVLIDQNFCPDAVAQGRHDGGTHSIKRTYLQGTSEQVDIAID